MVERRRHVRCSSALFGSRDFSFLDGLVVDASRELLVVLVDAITFLEYLLLLLPFLKKIHKHIVSTLPLPLPPLQLYFTSNPTQSNLNKISQRKNPLYSPTHCRIPHPTSL